MFHLWSNYVASMVSLKLKVGPKGQVVIPKFVRDKLRIKPKAYVVMEFEEDGLRLRGSPDMQDLILWLTSTRRPIAKNVSSMSLEEEILETLP